MTATGREPLPRPTAQSTSTEPRPERRDPVAVARELLSRLAVRHPHEIAIDLIAYHCGCAVIYRETGTGSADARVVRAGDRAILAIDARAEGTPRGRFSIAHELSHFLLHPDYDAIARIHGLARTGGREFRVETEANTCASEIVAPSWMVAPICADALPSLDAVGRLARAFNVSLTVAAKKWAKLARTGCAFVESRGDEIKRVVRAQGFRGAAFERRKLEEGTLTLDMARAGGERGLRVHSANEGRWGRGALDRDVIEECVTLGDGSPGSAVLTWLWHE